MADTAPLDFIYQAGEYNLEQACILFLGTDDAVDVASHIEQINIYEDIYSPFISGQITLRDTLDLPNIFGRSGKDVLLLKIRTNGLPDIPKNVIFGSFHIYKMGERSLAGDRMQLYTYHFMSLEFMTDMNTHISKAFKGTGDTIFKEIANTYYTKDQSQIRNFIADQSTANIKFIQNFWTPSKCIQYAAQHQVQSNQNYPFVFFENRDGFCFKDLYRLYQQEVIQVFVESDFSADVSNEKLDSGYTKRDPERDFQVVHETRVDTMFDYLVDKTAGAIRQKLTTYDLLKKEFVITDYKMRVAGRLNENPLYAGSVVETTEPARMYMSKYYDNVDFGNSTNSAYIQSRMSDMRLLNAAKLEIDVFGRTDYTVGKIVYYAANIKAQILKDTPAEEYTDKIYSGRYLITAINHRFDRSRHLATIELSKESSKIK